MHTTISPTILADYSVDERQARTDLAAAHRIAVRHGFNEGIFNHLTFVVPGRSDRYYQIPFGMHWSEVRASSFMEVGIDDGKVKRGSGEVERSCYCIHAPIHAALPQAKAVFHTHMPFASALTRLEDPRIKEIGQTEVGMMGEIAYDGEYTGPAVEPEEGERLAKIIGDKPILFMANH
ncbi:MAG: class II aldolase/adducin family protein, partial [Bradyrhizobium sp.]